MKKIYDGVIRTDDRGYARGAPPALYQALNQRSRYQLTTIRSFSRAVVWREVKDNSFIIRHGAARAEVSWQVTGIRHDAYARAHRIAVEVPKARRRPRALPRARELGRLGAPSRSAGRSATSVLRRRHDAVRDAFRKAGDRWRRARRRWPSAWPARSTRAGTCCPQAERDRIQPLAEDAKRSALDLRGAP